MSIFDEVKKIATPEVFARFFSDRELRRDGATYAALCIFHQEKSASLKLFPDGFKCFGCGERGSNIDLLIKAKLAATAVEAAKLIAEKFRIKFEEKKRKAGFTVEDLATAKKLPVKFLKELKVMNGKYNDKPAVVIIYQTENGDIGVIRYRLRLRGKDNFRWKPGSRLSLYGLQTVKSVQEKKWVLIVEGESDCWTCWHHNLPCVGVPGKNNWKREWKDFFNDLEVFVWEEPDAREFSLKILEDLPEAKVILAPDGIKDISEAHIQGKDVPRLIEELKADALRGEQLKSDSGKEEVPEELLEEIFHPALHIEREFAVVGVVTRNKATHFYQILTDTGVYPADNLEKNLTCKYLLHPELAGRWTKPAIVPTLSESVGLLISKAQSLISLEDERVYAVLAIWAAGTYLFPLFATFPYLNLTGEKGSGKTKILDMFNQVCFNPLQIVDPTAPVLFRMMHALRPTLLLDEVENFGSDDAREVKQIINAGYKRGATVPRCEGETHTIRFFDVYSPKTIAGIKPLGDVTEDRSIVIVMTKPDSNDTRQNIEVTTGEPIWQTIRNGFYRLPFDYREKVLTTALPLPLWLRARDRELWMPLLKIAAIVDEEGGLSIYDDALGLARESAISKGLTFETETILTVLETELGDADEVDVHPFKLCEAFQKAFNRKTVSPEWIASKLRRLGFKKSDPARDREGVIYKLVKAKINELRYRYGTPGETYTPTYAETCIISTQ